MTEFPYRGADDLMAMQRAVQRTWTPDSHWHIGDLAWQRPSMADRTVCLWTAPDGTVDTWAWIAPAAPRMDLHAAPSRIGTVLSWFDRETTARARDGQGNPGDGRNGGANQAVTAMNTDADLIGAATGFRDAGRTLTFRR